MSTILPVVNLVAAVVGSSGIIDLKPTGYTSDPGFTNNKATLQIQNESGSGLLVTTVTGQTSVYIGAGGWANILLTPGESGVQWTVIYQLPNPGVTLILSTFYRPGETVPQPSTLGNSPISVSQSPIVVTATNIVNTGNPAGTNIINAIVAGDAQAAVALTNDGILALGDALHGGGLSVVGTSTFTGRVQGDGTNNLQLDTGNPSRAITLNSAGVQEAFIDSNGLTINTKLNFAAGARVLSPVTGVSGFTFVFDTSAVGDFIRISQNGTSKMEFPVAGPTLKSGTLGLLTGTISKIAMGLTAVTTGGTPISHGLGATPSVVLTQVTVNSTAFVSGIGAATFNVTPTVNQNIFWLAAIV